MRSAARLVQRSARASSSTLTLPPTFRSFSSTARSLAPDEPNPSAGAKDKEKEKPQPEPEADTTVQGRSPFQAFVDVMKDEIRKSREFQESVKQLQGEATKVQDSETMRKAKEVYERARVSPQLRRRRLWQGTDGQLFPRSSLRPSRRTRGWQRQQRRCASREEQSMTPSRPLSPPWTRMRWFEGLVRQ
jgi:hypothetical protein